MAHCWRLSPLPAPPIIPSQPVSGRLGAAPVSRLVIISVKVLQKYDNDEMFKCLKLKVPNWAFGLGTRHLKGTWGFRHGL